jgi:hypothetical protein
MRSLRTRDDPKERDDVMTGDGATLVREGWNGPDRRDVTITPLKPEEDGLHIDMSKKGAYEWWYFDAHMESGHMVVAFFYAANPNPGSAGKTGVELVINRPDGTKFQKFVPYDKRSFSASRDKADIKVGQNFVKVKQSLGELPEYEVMVKEGDFGCHLRFKAQVNGWKPGSGISQFGDLGYFAWVVPFARASVEGTVQDRGKVLQVKGVGYHDHNWLDFPFQSIIEYWMWGRVYSQQHTVSFAFIQCNAKAGNHAVKVLMLADGKEAVLSTGRFEFIKEDFVKIPGAIYAYPKKLTIKVPNELEVSLTVRKVLESQDMLESFSAPLRLIARNILRLRPWYYRLESDFTISTTRAGTKSKETGTALHEIVMFHSAE